MEAIRPFEPAPPVALYEGTIRQIHQLAREIQESKDLDRLLAIEDELEKLRGLLRGEEGWFDVSQEAAEQVARAARKSGEILARMQLHRGGRPRKTELTVSAVFPRLADLGLDDNRSQRSQQIASIPEEAFEEHISTHRRDEKEITKASLLALAAGKTHVSHNSGEEEWYTPASFIEAARRVMGGIDLDPASTARANEIVKATRFYSAEDDGLAREWRGRVWMNPPYSSGLIEGFCEKLAREHRAGSVSAAVALVNNATETGWFQDLAEVASAICFPRRRIRFWTPSGETGAPLQGQGILYLGADREGFAEGFSGFGFIVYHGMELGSAGAAGLQEHA